MAITSPKQNSMERAKRRLETKMGIPISKLIGAEVGVPRYDPSTDKSKVFPGVFRGLLYDHGAGHTFAIVNIINDAYPSYEMLSLIVEHVQRSDKTPKKDAQ